MPAQRRGHFVHVVCGAVVVRMCMQDDAIRNLFSAQTKSEYSVSSLLTFSAMFFLLAVLSYGESE